MWNILTDNNDWNDWLDLFLYWSANSVLMEGMLLLIWLRFYRLNAIPAKPLLPSNSHHLSNCGCLEGKRDNYQVCSLQQLCTVQCTHIWTDLTVVGWLDLVFLCLYASPLILFPFENRLLHFQAGGCKKRPNLGFLIVLIYFVIVFFVFLMHDYLYSVSLGLLYIFVVIAPGFWFFVFSVLAERLAGRSTSEMTGFVSSGM